MPRDLPVCVLYTRFRDLYSTWLLRAPSLHSLGRHSHVTDISDNLSNHVRGRSFLWWEIERFFTNSHVTGSAGYGSLLQLLLRFMSTNYRTLITVIALNVGSAPLVSELQLHQVSIS